MLWFLFLGCRFYLLAASFPSGAIQREPCGCPISFSHDTRAVIASTAANFSLRSQVHWILGFRGGCGPGSFAGTIWICSREVFHSCFCTWETAWHDLVTACRALLCHLFSDQAANLRNSATDGLEVGTRFSFQIIGDFFLSANYLRSA